MRKGKERKAVAEREYSLIERGRGRNREGFLLNQNSRRGKKTGQFPEGGGRGDLQKGVKVYQTPARQDT